MHRRHITRTLGAAAGGLMGAAFLPMAVAFADDYGIVPDPGSTEVVTGIYGIGVFGVQVLTTPPAVGGSVQGTQLFEAQDTTSGTSGTFNADEATLTDIFGNANEEVLITQDVSGSAPPVGSVFDTYTFAGSGFENIYSDLASTTPGGDTISDTLVTPFGDFSIPVVFDGAAGLASDSFLGGAAGGPLGTAFPLADGNDIVPASAQGVGMGINAINGLSPLALAVQGYQEFDVENAGNPVGTFEGDVTTTGDTIGFTSEEVLVTADGQGTTAGTAAGDVPPVGSVFNTFFYGDSGYDYQYSDIPTPSGDVITTTLVTPYGDISLPYTFAATAAEVPVSVDLPNGDDIFAAPGSTEVLTGVNGLPPWDVSVQGSQLFDIDNAAGTAIGSFYGDETTTADPFGDTTQTLLVTSDGEGTAGTAAGDVPPVGSVIETITFGDTGIENIYTDLASTTAGGDLISDTLVTPLGDLTIPVTLDAAAGLAGDLFP